MKLKHLLEVLKDYAEIIDWNTMQKIGDYHFVFLEILDNDFKPIKGLEEKEVVFINNMYQSIRIGIK